MAEEVPPQTPFMPGKHGEWTIETSMTHLLALVAALDHQVSSDLLAMKNAIDIALAAETKAADLLAAENKEWRAQANEWRGALDDVIKETATREQLADVKDRVDEVRDEMRREVTRLSEVQAARSGRTSGVSLSFGAIAGVIAALGVLVGIGVAVGLL